MRPWCVRNGLAFYTGEPAEGCVLDWIYPTQDMSPPNSHPAIAMTDPRLIDEIGARLSEVLAKSPARDVEKNLQALLASFFDRFDLVTRDDFEVQKRVLERAHARIAELERRLGELEASETQGVPRV